MDPVPCYLPEFVSHRGTLATMSVAPWHLGLDCFTRRWLEARSQGGVGGWVPWPPTVVRLVQFRVYWRGQGPRWACLLPAHPAIPATPLLKTSTSFLPPIIGSRTVGARGGEEQSGPVQLDRIGGNCQYLGPFEVCELGAVAGGSRTVSKLPGRKCKLASSVTSTNQGTSPS